MGRSTRASRVLCRASSASKGEKGYFERTSGKWNYSIAKVNQMIGTPITATRAATASLRCSGHRRSRSTSRRRRATRLRALAFTIFQDQAQKAGIEFKPANAPSRLFFPQVSDLNYDIALFAWVGTGDPAGQVDIYGCAEPKTSDNPTGAGGSNWKGYCNPRVTALFKASDAQLNPALRVKENNQADAALSNDAISDPAVPEAHVLRLQDEGQGPEGQSDAPGPDLEHGGLEDQLGI